MDLIVMYAIENICQQKVSYDTSVGYVNSWTGKMSDLVLDDLDIEWIFNEIEQMCTLTFDDDVRSWIANEIQGKKMKVSDFINAIETQNLLVRSKKIASRNPAGKPTPLKDKRISLVKDCADGPRCALTEQKCDKMVMNKKTDMENICVKSNCIIAQNFYKLAQKMK